MASKPKSFRLDEKKKLLIVYSNVVASPAEVDLKNYYLSNGYKPMTEEKKPGKTVEQMRKELEKDPETLAAFNAAYEEKDGFFPACKIYTKWSKEHNEVKKKDKKK